MKQLRSLLSLFLLLFVLHSCGTAEATYFNKKNGINSLKKNKWNPKTPLYIEEFRAAWIATVANINWPSKPELSSVEQKKEAIALLDFLEKHNYNAAIFQVRPQADALYKSDLEPWSYYLTGKQGDAPMPYYDPLEFWVEEAHKRGLELHVWLNPYRAHHTQGKEISEKSIVKTHPELVVKLENGMYWMDPAMEGTKKHSLAVVKDIVSRYDIDGVHFDDYFYPYDSYNNGKDFPDEKSWGAYLKNGGKLSRNDWRRDHVNDFIKRVYQTIKEEKPYVKFGLSPFGIWRPGYPASVVGYDQYDKLFADAKLWLNKGWIDYFTPQLYWKINKEGQSFPELLGWWERENTQKRHLWPGIKMDHGGDKQNVDEVINQIMITRGMLPNSKGTVHWSIGPVVKYDTLSKALLEQPYAKKSLVPASPWLDNQPPVQPLVNLKTKDNTVNIIWSHSGKKDAFKFVLYYKYANGKWNYKIFSRDEVSSTLPLLTEKGVRLEKIGVTAVDRTGNQSLFKEKKIM
ncbi:glycoside hydrolase family 10 protein [Galbibacter mesophilus]|uniref:glycoside hydrolase family 10 protein n=1 Tax=Galbibacter mesophilus TaxID=379069 RepID=UPI0019202ADE|nr:family 10 glycosylhydrolase [Galbibacter mesophilus]MCM5663754.1 family 10 glycosylhydrolase [Galbibacter mesophilus]